MVTSIKVNNEFVSKKGTIRKSNNGSKMKTYKLKVLSEMKKLGAGEKDFSLVTDVVIKNAQEQKWKAEDLAWALMQ